MQKIQQKLWLNIVAFLCPLFAGYIALKTDAFLFLAVFCISAFASFNSSAQIKNAGRFSVLGFIFGFVALFILVKWDLG